MHTRDEGARQGTSVVSHCRRWGRALIRGAVASAAIGVAIAQAQDQATVKKPVQPAAIVHAGVVANDLKAKSGKLDLAPRTARAIAPFQTINLPALADRSVKAITPQGTATVDRHNALDMIGRRAVFVSRSGPAAEKLTTEALPAPLRDALPRTAQARAVRLNYDIEASRGEGEAPTRLSAYVIDGSGLSLDASVSSYVGDFYVGLANEGNPQDRSVLPTPIPIAISAVGAHTRPHPLMISQLGVLREVGITVPQPLPPTYPVRVSAGRVDEGDAVELAVLHPRITINASASHISGWGLGATTITVQALGFAAPQGYRVFLHADDGFLDPASVALDSHGTATTSFRSSAAGRGFVTVVNQDLVPPAVPVDVEFDPPVRFLLSAMGGGLVGAFLLGKRREHWARRLTVGALSGLLSASAYATGIHVAQGVHWAGQLASAGEAAVFVVGAMGGLFGVRKVWWHPAGSSA